jgi:hypothetical protein
MVDRVNAFGPDFFKDRVMDGSTLIDPVGTLMVNAQVGQLPDVQHYRTSRFQRLFLSFQQSFQGGHASLRHLRVLL